MISRIIDEKEIAKLRKLLEGADRIIITCHLTPDGDAIGSSLGLAHVLGAIGKRVTVLTPDAVPKHLRFLPGVRDTMAFSSYEEYGTKLLRDADLIFCLDYNEPKRVDRMESALVASKAPKVLIDHHLNPGKFTEVTISHPEVSSTSMLVFRTICRLELFDKIDRAAAECIFCGMMTDTGNFSYNSNDPDLYTVIAELLRKGIDKDAIYSRAMNTKSLSAMRLNGYALGEKMELFPDHKCSVISLNADELKRFGYEKGDTEGLVNQPLALPTVQWSAYLREDPEQIKVSMRSKGSFPVNRVCSELFGGGGHLNAAGGEFKGSLRECIDLLKDHMSDYDSFLPSEPQKK